MKAKRLLVLGIGYSQLDLILEAKKLGYEVFACSKTREGPGLHHVDGHRLIDVIDEVAIESYARELQVDAIYSLALEIAIPAINRVSKRLGLPYFVSEMTLDLISDKSAWRNQLADIAGNLKSMKFTDASELSSWSCFPAIIKPVDGSGQRGVFQVHSLKEMRDRFEGSLSYSRSQAVIVEEYAFGEEVSINAFLDEGRIVYSFLSDRVAYDEYPGGIIKAHLLPSKYAKTDVETKIQNMVVDICERMGFKEGHLYFQIKVHEDRPYLIEFTPRFDGCHMWKLIQHVTGINLVSCALRSLMKEKPEGYTAPSWRRGQYVLEFFSDVPGTIVKRVNYHVPINNACLNWYYEDDERVKQVTGFMEKVGFCIYEAK